MKKVLALILLGLLVTLGGCFKKDAEEPSKEAVLAELIQIAESTTVDKAASGAVLDGLYFSDAEGNYTFYSFSDLIMLTAEQSEQFWADWDDASNAAIATSYIIKDGAVISLDYEGGIADALEASTVTVADTGITADTEVSNGITGYTETAAGVTTEDLLVTELAVTVDGTVTVTFNREVQTEEMGTTVKAAELNLAAKEGEVAVGLNNQSEPVKAGDNVVTFTVDPIEAGAEDVTITYTLTFEDYDDTESTATTDVVIEGQSIDYTLSVRTNGISLKFTTNDVVINPEMLSVTDADGNTLPLDPDTYIVNDKTYTFYFYNDTLFNEDGELSVSGNVERGFLNEETNEIDYVEYALKAKSQEYRYDTSDWTDAQFLSNYELNIEFEGAEGTVKTEDALGNEITVPYITASGKSTIMAKVSIADKESGSNLLKYDASIAASISKASTAQDVVTFAEDGYANIQIISDVYDKITYATFRASVTNSAGVTWLDNLSTAEATLAFMPILGADVEGNENSAYNEVRLIAAEAGQADRILVTFTESVTPGGTREALDPSDFNIYLNKTVEDSDEDNFTLANYAIQEIDMLSDTSAYIVLDTDTENWDDRANDEFAIDNTLIDNMRYTVELKSGSNGAGTVQFINSKVNFVLTDTQQPGYIKAYLADLSDISKDPTKIVVEYTESIAYDGDDGSLSAAKWAANNAGNYILKGKSLNDDFANILASGGPVQAIYVRSYGERNIVELDLRDEYALNKTAIWGDSAQFYLQINNVTDWAGAPKTIPVAETDGYEPMAVTAITAAADAEFTTVIPHGLNVADTITIVDNGGATDIAEGSSHAVKTVPTPTTFTIEQDTTVSGDAGVNALYVVAFNDKYGDGLGDYYHKDGDPANIINGTQTLNFTVSYNPDPPVLLDFYKDNSEEQYIIEFENPSDYDDALADALTLWYTSIDNDGNETAARTQLEEGVDFEFRKITSLVNMRYNEGLMDGTLGLIQIDDGDIWFEDSAMKDSDTTTNNALLDKINALNDAGEDYDDPVDNGNVQYVLVELLKDWTQIMADDSRPDSAYYVAAEKLIVVAEDHKFKSGLDYAAEQEDYLILENDDSSPIADMVRRASTEDDIDIFGGTDEYQGAVSFLMSEPVQVVYTDLSAALPADSLVEIESTDPLTPSKGQGYNWDQVPAVTVLYVNGITNRTFKGQIIAGTIDERDYTFSTMPVDENGDFVALNTLSDDITEWDVKISSISDDVKNTYRTQIFPLILTGEQPPEQDEPEDINPTTYVEWVKYIPNCEVSIDVDGERTITKTLDDSRLLQQAEKVDGSGATAEDISVIEIKFSRVMKDGSVKGVEHASNYFVNGRTLPEGKMSVHKGIDGVTDDWDGVTLIIDEADSYGEGKSDNNSVDDDRNLVVTLPYNLEDEDGNELVNDENEKNEFNLEEVARPGENTDGVLVWTHDKTDQGNRQVFVTEPTFTFEGGYIDTITLNHWSTNDEEFDERHGERSNYGYKIRYFVNGDTDGKVIAADKITASDADVITGAYNLTLDIADDAEFELVGGIQRIQVYFVNAENKDALIYNMDLVGYYGPMVTGVNSVNTNGTQYVEHLEVLTNKAIYEVNDLDVAQIDAGDFDIIQTINGAASILSPVVDNDLNNDGTANQTKNDTVLYFDISGSTWPTNEAPIIEANVGAGDIVGTDGTGLEAVTSSYGMALYTTTPTDQANPVIVSAVNSAATINADDVVSITFSEAIDMDEDAIENFTATTAGAGTLKVDPAAADNNVATVAIDDATWANGDSITLSNIVDDSGNALLTSADTVTFTDVTAADVAGNNDID